jgi:hypothetical protein
LMLQKIPQADVARYFTPRPGDGNDNRSAMGIILVAALGDTAEVAWS